MLETPILIGELSRRTGCHIETIRYYERIGVIPKAQRRGRYRSYRTDDVSRLRFIHRARELGFSLAEVRALLDLGSQNRSGSCSRVKTVATQHVRSVRAKIADLERLVIVLEDAIARCKDGQSPHCPILDTLADA
jgi:MerR family mercuric resistance operon transcriptional regulator